MSPSSGPPIIFDTRRRAARLNRSAATLARADFLHARAADNAVHSLEVLLRDWPAAYDLSSHPGAFASALRASSARDRVGEIRTNRVGIAPGEQALAVPDGSQDLIVSLMSLHWANDLPGALAQIRRALKPDGLFLGTLLGAGTLKELRVALTEAELEVRGGAQARVSPFADGFDGAALLQRAGFALPVSDVDRLTVRYADVSGLVRDLRAMGETNALAGTVRPLTHAVWTRAAEIYADRFSEPDGRVRATFEIVHLAGWAPHESQQKPLARGSATVRLANALGTREWTGEEP